MLLRLLKARGRLAEHHSAQMPKRGQGAGHDHVLAAIADAIHAKNTWKGKGKGKNGKSGKGGGNNEVSLAGRNCTQCGDYNFEHRYLCRYCGAVLPLPSWNGKGAPPSSDNKGAGKGAWGPWNKGSTGQKASGGDGGGTGGKTEGGESLSQAQAPATSTGKEDNAEAAKDPTERVKEIRAEEERLRKARSQFVDVNPRMVAVIDSEMASLSAEREQLQPLEINLQAAAGRTANARASLAKARERKETAAKELRARLEAYHAAEREVKEAEEKLRATEAAATARRSEAKIHGVQDAVDFLQAATEKVTDKNMASEVAAALQKIAHMLNGFDANVGSGAKDEGGATGAGTTAAGQAAADGGNTDGERSAGIIPVRGSSPAKKLLLEKPPTQTGSETGASSGEVAGNVHGGKGCGGAAVPINGDGQAIYAGGAVDGEVVMGSATEVARENADDLVAQAAAALGDDAADL